MINRDCIIHIEKGISIYTIEYILLYYYGYMYDNSGDHHQDTLFKITDISDGKFNFFLYGHKANKKLIDKITGDTNFFSLGIPDDTPVISSNKLLRKHKLNKIQTKIKKSCTH